MVYNMIKKFLIIFIVVLMRCCRGPDKANATRGGIPNSGNVEDDPPMENDPAMEENSQPENDGE